MSNQVDSRPLGLWSATALVVGSMIGSGVFLLPASLAPYGTATLIGWSITLCGAVLLALTFAKLATRWPQTGGPYVYARNAFGELPGFAVAWSYWVSVWCANAAIAVAFAGSIGAVFPAATATPLRSAACALAALWTAMTVHGISLHPYGSTLTNPWHARQVADRFGVQDGWLLVRFGTGVVPPASPRLVSVVER